MNEQPTPASPVRFSPPAFAGWLALFLGVGFPDVVLGLGSFVLRDFAVFGYPLAEYHKAVFWRGELPLWNPFVYCGVPHLAQWNTLTLYPGSLIYLLPPVPVSLSLSWFCLLHLYAGGLGMYFLVRHHFREEFPAALAGVAFAFSGLLQNCLMWPNNIAALGLMPWVVLAVIRGCADGRRALLIAAAVGALQMLTGAPEMILFTWLMASAAVGLLAYSENGWRGALRRAFPLIGIVALVTGLTAVQLLPFFDLVRHSVRISHGHEMAWSAATVFWTNMFLPMAGADHFANGVVFPQGQDWIHSVYSGLPVVWLALVSLQSRRSVLVRAATLSVLVAMLLATGPSGCLFSWLDRVLPLEAIRFPVKFLVPVFFILPLLAAKGVRVLFPPTEAEPSALSRLRPAMIALGIVTALFGLSTLLIGTGDIDEDPAASWRNGLERLIWLAVVVALAWRFRSASGPRSAAWLQLGLLVVVWWDLKTHLPALAPRVPPRIYEVENETLAGLQPRPSPPTGRLFQMPGTEWRTTTFSGEDFDMHLLLLRAEAQPMLQLPERAASIQGFLALWFPLYNGITTILTDREGRLNHEFADFLAISHTNSPVEIGTWNRRPGAHAWVTAGMAPKFLSVQEAHQRISNGWWDAEKEVFLGQPWRAEVGDLAPCNARIGELRFESGRVRFEIQCEQPTIAVLAQSYHHWWHATVDGRATAVMPANLGFQAVRVPAGHHRVELRYHDRWLQAGAVLSCLTLALSSLLWWRWRRSALTTTHVPLPGWNSSSSADCQARARCFSSPPVQDAARVASVRKIPTAG